MEMEGLENGDSNPAETLTAKSGQWAKVRPTVYPKNRVLNLEPPGHNLLQRQTTRTSKPDLFELSTLEAKPCGLPSLGHAIGSIHTFSKQESG
jgi:hypothetical protein